MLGAGRMPAEARAWGYVAAALALAGAWAVLLRRWRGPGPANETIAARLERLFPQARGLAVQALAEPDRGLLGARAGEGRAWLVRRGPRLDTALATTDRKIAARVRRAAALSAALLAAALVARPEAARRAAQALAAPSDLWRSGAAAWRVEPGSARVPYGADVEGRAREEGPPSRSPIVLEWAAGDGAWRAETLGPGPAVGWRWEGLVSSRDYRLRRGSSASPAYRLEVGPPLAVEAAELRRPGGEWEPMAGQPIPVGARIEVRGRASDALAEIALVRDGAGGGLGLAVDGAAFAGDVLPVAGAWWITLRAVDGRSLRAAAFHAVVPGEASVTLLRPTQDPVHLGAVGAWLEVRTIAPDGVRSLGWETADGRRGSLGDPRGSRDTTLVAIAALAAGRGAGDTVRYRAAAVTTTGRSVATPWRTALVAEASILRDQAAAERARALRAIDRATAEARDASTRGEGRESSEADRRVRQAGEALAAALERTLADPALGPETRERLEAYRRMLEAAVHAPVARTDDLPGPGVVRARADLLREIASAVARAEEELARVAAADSLARLAEAQRALATETRRTPPDRVAQAIGPRQEALARSARSAAERLPPDSAERIDEALERAAHEVEGGDPEQAAGAQEEAGATLSRASEEARTATEADAARQAARRAAVDRAAGESLFLAERQRAVAERLGSPSRGADERAERLARQRVVTQGLDRTLAALVEGLGGLPAGGDSGELLAEALMATRSVEEALSRTPGPAGEGQARAAARRASTVLELLARAFLLPPDSPFSMAGQGSASQSGALARQLDGLAAAQRAIADAAARAEEAAGGNPEAAAAERELGREIGGMGPALEEHGIDRRAVDALVAAVEDAARRLERGLSGALTESELRSLARRFADLGRIVERREGERQAVAARAFVPPEPPPLPARVTGRRLDPEAALAPWTAALPRAALDPARRYLERLADEGVRAPMPGP